ncbi:hypothetical protein GLOIN_2v1778212 [Rhizophagus clarus]|uniref:Uncharacterized protein n=1 Tax=Rhizophagus clarus TaxID=94130 RepID=A0A8H3LYD0_9GLOM|nr:hypothetical protein GLOIN_2v1778212 [Rhizophagus clarus]
MQFRFLEFNKKFSAKSLLKLEVWNKCVIEIGKLNVIIVELEKNRAVTTKLESENDEFRDRITKVEQRQMQNDNVTKVANSSNNSSSNFNLRDGCFLGDEQQGGDQNNVSELQVNLSVSAELSLPSAPIPITQVSNFSGGSQIKKGEV